MIYKKIKICFVAPKAYPFFNPKNKLTKKIIMGGGEIQLGFIAKELAKDNSLDINFMVADYGQRNIEEWSKVKVFKFLNFKNNPFKRLYHFIRIFNKINADLYVQRALDAGGGIIALYCNLKRKKFVYMVAHDKEVNGKFERNHSIFSNFLANLTFKLADQIIVQNILQREILRERLNLGGILIKSMYSIKLKSKNFRRDSILWVGRCEEWKRPKIFLSLAKKFPNEKFVMICPPALNQSEYFNKVKENASKIKNLKFIEYVPFNKIQKYFNEARVFINTSDQEGFPNTFIQAGIGKTPIISLNVDPNNFLEKYNCGFCCKDNFEIACQNLKKLLKNRSLYQKMSNNVFKYVKENHDIKLNIKKFEELIKTNVDH